MHALLRRQIRKSLGEHAEIGSELASLLAAVDAAYVASDEERTQLERSLFLASDELFERNRLLEQQLEERKRLEVELQHAEKLRAVGQLAAGVAHEINTPVQFLGDNLHFLSDAVADIGLASGATPVVDANELVFLRDQIPVALQRCREGVERVSMIVRALKYLAHPDTVEQQPADLHAAINNTLILAANEIKYVADVGLQLCSARVVCCHVGEIQQVLLNLLVNAGHAIADRVRDTGDRGMIRVATYDDNADVVITVSDDGAGIPNEIRSRIFEPFFTTKPLGQGTGQGLSIAHALIVKSHGGQLTFDSTAGVGTTFTIRIPIAGRSSTAATRPVAG